MNISDVIEKRHVSYTSASDIYQICQPLFNNFGATIFDYSRLYNDDSFLVLDSNGESFVNFCKDKNPVSGAGNWGQVWTWDMVAFIQPTAKNTVLIVCSRIDSVAPWLDLFV